MPRSVKPYQKKLRPPSFHKLFQPVVNMSHQVPALESRGDRPLNRGYQEHAEFDSLQAEGKSFVIRIKANTTKTVYKR